MNPRENGKGQLIAQRETARFSLSKSGFSSTVGELTRSLSGVSVQEVTWDERGRCSVEGIEGKPQSAGILIRLGEKQFPEIEDGKILGMMTTFYAVVVEAHPDGSIDVRGFETVTNSQNGWKDKKTQKKALRQALHYPFIFRSIRPIPNSERRKLVPYRKTPFTESIETRLQNMARMASVSGKTVVSNFNDFSLVVRPGQDVKPILDDFEKQSNRNLEESENWRRRKVVWHDPTPEELKT